VTVEGDLWKFHLGITLPPLAAESVARLVWDETARQVEMMVGAWRPEDSNKDRIYALTMNTMSLVGFGRQAEWGESDQPDNSSSGTHKYSLVAALTNVTMHLPYLLLLPRWLLRLSPWAFVYHSANEVDQYIAELLAEERQKLQEDSSVAHRENLLTAVLRSNMSARGKKLKDLESIGRSTFTDEEIKGNVFIFLFAGAYEAMFRNLPVLMKWLIQFTLGYDTTANTTLFTTLILMLHKDLQDRVIEEIDAVYAQANKQGRTELSYTEDFPRFRYLVAFMVYLFPCILHCRG
jgi:cytochrome P450